MSDLSPLPEAKRKLDFGAVRAAFDPEQTSLGEHMCYSKSAEFDFRTGASATIRAKVDL
jgi:hypothetical protein